MSISARCMYLNCRWHCMYLETRGGNQSTRRKPQSTERTPPTHRTEDTMPPSFNKYPRKYFQDTIEISIPLETCYMFFPLALLDEVISTSLVHCLFFSLISSSVYYSHSLIPLSSDTLICYPTNTLGFRHPVAGVNRPVSCSLTLWYVILAAVQKRHHRLCATSKSVSPATSMPANRRQLPQTSPFVSAVTIWVKMGVKRGKRINK